MKELSTEEKAKRYDEAIKKAGERYNEEYTSTLERSTLAYVFHELAESEDERIRKELIDYFKENNAALAFRGISNECVLAWLEKQGEQKPTDKVELKFKVGDVVRSSNNTMLKIVGITDYCYNCVTCATNDEYSFGFDIQDEFELVEQKPAWSEEDEYCRHQLIVFCENCMQPDSGAIRCANWLKSIKDRVGCEADCTTKQEWSEEDERVLNATINTVLISRNSCEEDDEVKDRYDDELRWLKSLKPQSTWKPSDEQMEALTDAMDKYCGMYKATLCSLYNNLKKLKR